jgi:TRAP-type C4-dicarboxylate transport system substrate-binding protein
MNIGKGCGALTTLSIMFAVLVPPAAAETTLRVISGLPQNHDLTQSYMEHFHKPFNAEGKGKAQLNYMGGPEVTPRTKQASSMQRGLVDMIFAPASYYFGVLPEARPLAMSNVSVEEMRKNGAFDLLQEAWKKRINGMIIGWCCTDQVFHFYTSFEPKVDSDGKPDLRGSRMRSTELYNPIYEALGATPVTIDAPELYTSMQRGVVQGFGFPEGGVVALGVKDMTKYRIDTGFFRGTSMIAMNHDKFMSLPKEVRDFIVAKGIAYEKDSIGFIRRKAKEDLKALEEAGMKRFKLSPAGDKAFLKAAYDAGWELMKRYKTIIDIEKLKLLILKP